MTRLAPCLLALATFASVAGCLKENSFSVDAANHTGETVVGTIHVHFAKGNREVMNQSFEIALPPNGRMADLAEGEGTGTLTISVELQNGTAVQGQWARPRGGGIEWFTIDFRPDHVYLDRGAI